MVGVVVVVITLMQIMITILCVEVGSFLLLDPVEEPVHFGCPLPAVRHFHLLLEVFERLFLLLVHGERLSEVADVVQRLQLGNAA